MTPKKNWSSTRPLISHPFHAVWVVSEKALHTFNLANQITVMRRPNDAVLCKEWTNKRTASIKKQWTISRMNNISNIMWEHIKLYLQSEILCLSNFSLLSTVTSMLRIDIKYDRCDGVWFLPRTVYRFPLESCYNDPYTQRWSRIYKHDFLMVLHSADVQLLN